MRLSTTTNYLVKKITLRETIDIIADAGYDAVDFTATGEEYYTDAHNADFYTEMRKYAGDRGLVFNQAHAPYASSFTEPERTQKRFFEITTAMKHASLLGVKNIVVHPCQHLEYSREDSPEILFEMNMDFYRRLIPYCEEYDIRVAIENMFQSVGGRDNRKIVHSTCSRPEEFLRYLDGLNNDAFVACLDLGHAELVCQSHAEFIKKLGNKYLQCLHVHDNDGIHDSHTLPYQGVIDWDSVCKALADIDYKGDFTFEAMRFMENVPVELWRDAEKYMAATGRYLISKIESYK